MSESPQTQWIDEASQACLDRFSCLDDLPAKDRKNTHAVLTLLAKVGKFSAFEASEHGDLASTLSALMRSPLIARIWGEYPWTHVEVSGAGWHYLRQGLSSPPHQERPR